MQYYKPLMIEILWCCMETIRHNGESNPRPAASG
jgi:hypothetical protein